MALKCAEIFNYNSNLIIPINEINQKAIRPNNASLDITKLKRLIGPDINIYSLGEGLKDMKINRN